MKKFSETGLPAPNQYEDWRSWAAALMVALDGMSGEDVHNFPLYVRREDKIRSGLPMAEEGDMIRVLDTDKKIRFYVWQNSNWELVNGE